MRSPELRVAAEATDGNANVPPTDHKMVVKLTNEEKTFLRDFMFVELELEG